jgi:hypothetical protein
MRAETLADALGGRRSGDGWIARCPAHNDRHPSLSINEGTDGRVLLHCHAGCSVEAILAAQGLETRDLFETPLGEGRGAPSPAIRFEHSNGSGLTLADYAAAKQLPEAFLRTLGLTEIPINGQ